LLRVARAELAAVEIDTDGGATVRSPDERLDHGPIGQDIKLVRPAVMAIALRGIADIEGRSMISAWRRRRNTRLRPETGRPR
jgi:hypothetical protein